MSVSTFAPVATTTQGEMRVARLQKLAARVLRYGLVFLLLMWGGFKFTSFEAEGIRPLIASSPLMSWMYSALSVRAASDVIGVIEIAMGLSLAAHRKWPKLAGYAGLGASGMFLITLSFLVTTPGLSDPSNVLGGFLLKDLMLLGAALFAAGESFAAAGRARR